MLRGLSALEKEEAVVDQMKEVTSVKSAYWYCKTVRCHDT